MFRSRWLVLVAASMWVAASASAQDPIRWENDLEAAKQQAARSGRLVLLHFGATWCPPCQRLEKQVFSRPGFGRSLSAHYVPVKLDFDRDKAVAQQYGVSRIPADVVITPAGEMVQRITPSPDTAEKYEMGFVEMAIGIKAAAPSLAALNVRGVPSYENQAATPPASSTPMADANHAEPAAAARPQTSYTDDRYAAYFNARSGAAAGTSSAPAPQPNAAPAPTNPPRQPDVAPYRVSSQFAGQPAAQTTPTNAHAPTHPPVQASAPQATAPERRPSTAASPPVATVKLPPGCPPLCLDGYCPVTLIERGVWHRGDARWGAIHRGRTYLFATQSQQQRFLASPDRYSPVASGNDPVMALEQGQTVPGCREHGLLFGERIYLFADETTMARFSSDPKRFAADLTQAMQTSDTLRR